MDRERLQARIQHESAELLALHPRIALCRTTLEQGQGRGESRYALRLDIRWPEHQTLVSGPPQPSAEAAVAAGFAAAREQLAPAPIPTELTS